MEFTVITYGAGEVLNTTFNAIAALLNAKTGTLYQPLVRCSLIVGLVWTTASMIQGDAMKFLSRWMIPVLVSLLLFFAPTCRVHLQDPVAGTHVSVEHVPWGLGAVAGVISRLGDTLTREIEKTFSLPDDLKYHKTGAVMASNLIANARTFHITDSDLAETLQSFITQCVVYEALLGKKYTLDDVKKTPDLWKLACENPSPARSFIFKPPGKGQKSQITTCEKGVSLLNGLLQKNVQNAFSLFEGKVLGKQDAKEIPYVTSLFSGAQLKRYLPVAFDYMTQMARTAEDTMMQQMMIYAFVDTLENTSTRLGNPSNVAVRRAYLQSRAHEETLAGVASQKLLATKHVLEALIYASFIFILPLALLPQGWHFITRWIGLVLWIQFWPPLYAILNFMMNVSVRSNGIGMIASPLGSGITIANSVGFMDLHADMAAQAGLMSFAVGSLAYALVKGGAASLSHLASHMTGPSLGAASRAAEERLSGNYSFGNVSQGNVQATNATLGQQNFSPSYTSGSFTQNDGVISRTTGVDGEHRLAVSNSSLRSNFSFSESLSDSYLEQSSHAKQLSETQQTAAAQAEADHHRQVMDFSQHQAQQASSNEGYLKGDSGSISKAFTNLDGLVDRFAKEHGVSKEIASQSLARAAVSMGMGIRVGLGGLGGTVGATGETSLTVMDSSSSRTLESAAKDYAKQHHFQDALSHASQVAREMRHTSLSEEGKRAASSLNDVYEKSHHMREEASASLQQSHSFSQMASWSRQHAASINANLNQAYVQWLQAQSLPNASGPMGIHEAETLLSARPELDQIYQQRFLEERMQHLGSHGIPTSGAEIEEAYAHARDHLANPVTQTVPQKDLGGDFNIDTHARDEAQKGLHAIEAHLANQEAILKEEAQRRKIPEKEAIK